MSDASELLSANREFAGLQVENSVSMVERALGLVGEMVRNYTLERVALDPVEPPPEPERDMPPPVDLDPSAIRGLEIADDPELSDIEPIDPSPVDGWVPPSYDYPSVSIPSTSAARGVEIPKESGIGDVVLPKTGELEGVKTPTASGIKGLQPPSTTGLGGVAVPTSSGIGGLAPPDKGSLGSVTVPLVGGIQYRDPGAAPVAPTLEPPEFGGDTLAPEKLEDLPDVAYTKGDEAGTALYEQITSVLDTWMDYHAPRYQELNGYLDDALKGVLQGGESEEPTLFNAFEQAIYDRMRQRIDDESKAAETQISEAMSKRGYVLPQIALSAQLAQSATAAADRAAKAATEAAVERAKMGLQHMQFVMQLASEGRQLIRAQLYQAAATMVELFRTAYARGKEYGDAAVSQSQVNAANFKAYIDKYGADWGGEESKGRVFSAEVGAYQASIEGAKAELQGQVEKLRGDIDAGRISLERARAMVETDTAVFRTEVDWQVAASRFDIDAARINLEKNSTLVNADTAVFRAEVDQQVAQSRFEVDAARIALERGTALVGAETAIMRADVEKQVAASRFEIDAARIGLERGVAISSYDAERGKAEAQIATAEGGFELDRGRLELQAATEQVRASGAVMEAELKRALAIAQYKIEAVKAKVMREVAALESGDAKRVELEQANWRAGLDFDIAKYGHHISSRGISMGHRNAKLSADAAVIGHEAQLQQESMRIAAQIAAQTASTAAQIASGALSAVNGVAGVSHSTIE